MTTYDPERRWIAGTERTVQMTLGTAELLDLLLSRVGLVVRRERAMVALRGAWCEPIDPKSMDVAICRLRRVLVLAGSDWRIETVRQAGWVLECPRPMVGFFASLSDEQKKRVMGCSGGAGG